MYEDLHYRFELAGARQYMESPEEVVALREMGYLLGGTEACMLVANGDRWVLGADGAMFRDWARQQQVVCVHGVASRLTCCSECCSCPAAGVTRSCR
jgi:hypothetical protein